MTHPDILRMEKFGELYPAEENVAMGKCLYCGEMIYSSDLEYTESIDGVFCDMDCCHNYYEIRTAN